jgi:hypothetical protein
MFTVKNMTVQNFAVMFVKFNVIGIFVTGRNGSMSRRSVNL